MNDEMSSVFVDYNSDTYNLEKSNDTLIINYDGFMYKTVPFSEKKHVIKLTYHNICILSNNILYVYVVLQYIMGKNTLIELSKHDWDCSKWNIQITSVKNLPDWAKILNCLLNLGDDLNKPFDIKKLETIKLNDKRGWGGERPREVYYKMGFPLYTPRTKKSLKNRL